LTRELAISDRPGWVRWAPERSLRATKSVTPIATTRRATEPTAGDLWPKPVRSPDPFPLEEMQDAQGASALAKLPERLRDQLLVGAVRAEVPKGRLVDGPPLCLVVSGLIRVALGGPDGRRFTVAYLHHGDLAGLARVTNSRTYDELRPS
jgi:hypothetical protein